MVSGLLAGVVVVEVEVEVGVESRAVVASGTKAVPCRVDWKRRRH